MPRWQWKELQIYLARDLKVAPRFITRRVVVNYLRSILPLTAHQQRELERIML